MKILLFGITNVGKYTIGKMLSKELNYDFDDIDDEIKKQYKAIYILKKISQWLWKTYAKREYIKGCW